MAISDTYTGRAALSVAATSATAALSLYGTAAKRLWIVGCRVEIENAGSTPAGNQVLFQLVRPSATNTGSSLASGVAHDFSAPASIGQIASAWSVAPTVGTVLADWTLPQTTGSSWEEFPPLGYEWGVPAVANANANAGIHLFITQNNSTSTTYVVELVWSE